MRQRTRGFHRDVALHFTCHILTLAHLTLASNNSVPVSTWRRRLRSHQRRRQSSSLRNRASLTRNRSKCVEVTLDALKCSVQSPAVCSERASARGKTTSFTSQSPYTLTRAPPFLPRSKRAGCAAKYRNRWTKDKQSLPTN